MTAPTGLGAWDAARVVSSGDINAPFYILASVWTSQFGRSPASFRSLAAVFGVLAIGATFVAGRALGGPGAGLILATLMALSPSQLAFSQAARQYSLWVWSFLLWTASLVRALDGGGKVVRLARAATVNGAERPALYASVPPYDDTPFSVIALAPLLRPDTPIVIMREPGIPKIPDRTIFLLSPNEELLTWAREQGAVEPLNDRLYQVHR